MEKGDLSKGYQNPKRKLGVTTHFSEIIELKLGEKSPYTLCILTLFYNYGCLIISEKCVVSTFLFLDSNCPSKDLPFLHSRNLSKNTSVLGGTVLIGEKKSFRHEANGLSKNVVNQIQQRLLYQK